MCESTAHCRERSTASRPIERNRPVASSRLIRGSKPAAPPAGAREVVRRAPETDAQARRDAAPSAAVSVMRGLHDRHARAHRPGTASADCSPWRRRRRELDEEARRPLLCATAALALWNATASAARDVRARGKPRERPDHRAAGVRIPVRCTEPREGGLKYTPAWAGPASAWMSGFR